MEFNNGKFNNFNQNMSTQMKRWILFFVSVHGASNLLGKYSFFNDFFYISEAITAEFGIK